MTFKRSQITQEHLPIIRNLIPENDPQYSSLRGYVNLCLNDKLMSFEQISQTPIFQEFVRRYSDDIMNEINRQHTIDLHHNEIDKAHDTYHLGNIFKQLEANALSTQKPEHVGLKLRDASGMTEFPTKRSFTDIQLFIQDLQLAKDPSKIIGCIKNHLQKEGLYENNTHKTYRVGLALSSKQILSLSIEHDDQKSQQGFNGFRYELTGNRGKIINIIHQRGYFHDTIEEALQIIIDKSDYDEEEDMDMAW